MAEKELVVLCMDCGQAKKPGTDGKVQKDWSDLTTPVFEWETSNGICPRCLGLRWEKLSAIVASIDISWQWTIICVDCGEVKNPGMDGRVQGNWKKRDVTVPEWKTSNGICPRCLKAREKTTTKELDEIMVTLAMARDKIK